jgi:hypothetical protein
VIVDAIDLRGVLLRGGASWPMNICPCPKYSLEVMGMYVICSMIIYVEV